MTNNEAIKVIKANWPPENYSILREALTLAICVLSEEDQPLKSCSYYAENGKKPCCTHDCDECVWYVLS